MASQAQRRSPAARCHLRVGPEDLVAVPACTRPRMEGNPEQPHVRTHRLSVLRRAKGFRYQQSRAASTRPGQAMAPYIQRRPNTRAHRGWIDASGLVEMPRCRRSRVASLPPRPLERRGGLPVLFAPSCVRLQLAGGDPSHARRSVAPHEEWTPDGSGCGARLCSRGLVAVHTRGAAARVARLHRQSVPARLGLSVLFAQESVQGALSRHHVSRDRSRVASPPQRHADAQSGDPGGPVHGLVALRKRSRVAFASRRADSPMQSVSVLLEATRRVP
jgi:hypothetical protein